MKKTWNRVIIISFIIILLELAGAVVFFMSPYKMYTLFERIDAGQWSKAKEIYDGMSSEQQAEAMSYMDDYALTVCQEYIDGEKSFTHTAASFDAINSIDATGSISASYMPDICHNEYKRAINELFDANRKFDTSKAFDAQNNIAAVQQRMDNPTREQIMIEMLNEKYQSFLDGTLSESDISSFAAIISGMAYSEAHSYVGVIVNNVSSVKRYRELYNEAEIMLDSDEYFGVMDICKVVVVDAYDTKYQELYSTLYEKAYITGKTYYSKILDSYVAADDSENAMLLMEKIEQYDGSDIDLGNAKKDLADDWQKKYIDIVDNVDAILQMELSASDLGQYILDNEYKNLKPDSVLLHDIDADGIPELFLFNKAQMDKDYVGCFIFGYNEENYSYLGFVNVMELCTDSNIIATPAAFDRTIGEEYVLMSYDGSSITETASCQNIDGTYYADYAAVSDVDYLSAQSSILSHSNGKGIADMEYVDIKDSESYIIAFE